MYKLNIAIEALVQLDNLKGDPALSKRYEAVKKALRFLQSNPKHQGLQTHRFYGKTGTEGEKVFEAYAENNTPGAYRIFFHYGLGKGVIIILEITPLMLSSV